MDECHAVIKDLKGFCFAVTDCRSSSLSYVMFGLFPGLVAEDQRQSSLAVKISLCYLPGNLMKKRIGTVILKMSIYVISVINLFFFFLTQDENIPFCLGNDADSLCFEIGLKSCQI